MEEKKITPQERYRKKYMKRFSIDLVTTTESDIIDKLNSVPNKAGYIKSLIRADIAKNKEKSFEEQAIELMVQSVDEIACEDIRRNVEDINAKRIRSND